MIDHVYVSVTDPARSLNFYAAALAPLGWREFLTYDSASGPDTVPDLWGLTDGAGDSGDAISASIWLRQRIAGETGLYLGLVAGDPAQVDAANVLDFDGNRVEIVHKSWNPAKAV